MTPGGLHFPERQELLRSILAISADAPNPDRVGLCLDTLLNDLELYDDPRQGRGAWLYEKELQLVDDLGVALNSVVGASRAIEAGPQALADDGWARVRAVAAELAALMEQNGSGLR